MNKTKKLKKYAIENELIMSKWDYIENEKENLDPKKILQGSHKKVHFKCPNCGRKWISEVRYGYKYNGCTVCSKKTKVEHWMEKRLKKTKSLLETNPELLKEWDYVENKREGLDPNYLTKGSNKEAYWICPLGHKYKAIISNRALKKTGCKYCSGQAVLTGFNDLQSQLPELAKEWSSKNEILPNEVTLNSKRKVFWICPFGHEDYLMSVKERKRGQGCPICAKQSQTSFPEQAIYYYIKKIYPDTINRYIQDRKEIDIFIPSKQIGIEYNGYFSHKGKHEKDINKKNFFKSQNINLIVVKEYKNDDEKKDADFYIYERVTYKTLDKLIRNILEYISPKYDININCEKDLIKIKEQYVTQKKEKSIAAIRPDLVDRWDYERNGKITPEMVTLGTGHRYYWKCKICKRSYLAYPSDIAKGSVCSRHRNLLKPGINDFATKYPDLLKYWDYDKNDVLPSEVYGGGETMVHWKCDKGHSYENKILKIINGGRCPICSGKKVLKGYNDLVTIHPELVNEWDYIKNKKRPEEYTANSNKEVWWICNKCNYNWKSKISKRKQCPNCKKEAKIINVYSIKTGKKIYTFNNMKDLCNNLNIDYNKSHGNISSICNRKQKTLKNLYVLRYKLDDEFRDLNDIDRKKQIMNYLNNNK